MTLHVFLVLLVFFLILSLTLLWRLCWFHLHVLATWVICSQNSRLQNDLTSPLLAEQREMKVQSIRFAPP